MWERYEIKYIRSLLSSIENQLTKDRLENILIWNIKKSCFYKNMFYGMSVTIIIINAGIPVINQALAEANSKLIITVFSTLASVFASILTLVGVKDKWYRYRKYTELLKRECIFYITKSGVYHLEQRECEFIENIEAICSDERELWEKSNFKKVKV